MWADRDTAAAAGAGIGNHTMKLAGGAYDGVIGALLDAATTAIALFHIYGGNHGATAVGFLQ